MPYIVISVAVFGMIAVIAGWLILAGRGQPRRPISALGLLALILAVAGIILGQSRLVGYGLLGAAILVAMLDIVRIYVHRRDEDS